MNSEEYIPIIEGDRKGAPVGRFANDHDYLQHLYFVVENLTTMVVRIIDVVNKSDESLIPEEISTILNEHHP